MSDIESRRTLGIDATCPLGFPPEFLPRGAGLPAEDAAGSGVVEDAGSRVPLVELRPADRGQSAVGLAQVIERGLVRECVRGGDEQGLDAAVEAFGGEREGAGR